MLVSFMGDIVLRQKELEFILNSSLIKINFLNLVTTKCLLPSFFRHFFRGLAVGSSNDKVFLVFYSFKTWFCRVEYLHKGNAGNVSLITPIIFYLIFYLFNVRKYKHIMLKFLGVLFMYKGIFWYIFFFLLLHVFHKHKVKVITKLGKFF